MSNSTTSIRWLTALTMFSFGCSMAFSGEKQNDKRLDAALAVVEHAVAEGEVPGAIAVVTKDGKVLRQEAYGNCDIENDRPMKVDTICWLASITKPVTVAAAMKLVEQGKLSLDDPVEKYLPEFKQQLATDGKHYFFTIRQLMSHSSGIQTRVPTRPRNFFDQSWLGRDMAEIAPEIAQTELEYKPGSRVQYSNAAPYVLARVIELRAGVPFHQFVQETILDPLDMDETYFMLPPAKAQRYAVVYRRQRGEQDVFFRFDPAWNMKMTMPDGGLFAPPGDVARFVQMFLDNDGRVLSKDSVRQMLTEQKEGWGLGWSLEKVGSFSHTGSAGTLAWGDPKTGVVGILFFQIQDQRTIQPLRDRFREAVKDALK